MADEIKSGEDLAAMPLGLPVTQPPKPVVYPRDGLASTTAVEDTANASLAGQTSKPNQEPTSTHPSVGDAATSPASASSHESPQDKSIGPQGLTADQQKQYEKVRRKYRATDHSDPTEPFRFSDRLGLSFEQTQIDRWNQILNGERLLVLQSHDWQVLRAAGDTIVRSMGLAQNRQLNCGGQVESPTEASGLGILLRGDYGAEALIVVWAHLGSASSFLASLPTDSTNTLRKLLARRKRILVTILPDKLSNSDEGHRRYLDTIPYEEPHLRTKFPDSYKELAAEIKKLKLDRRWGSDEEAALGLTLTLLRENKLEPEIRARRLASWRPDAKVQHGLQNRAPLENAIKFVGAYFTSSSEEGALSPDYFQRILCLLLSDRVIEAETSFAHPNMPAQVIVRKRVLVDEWRLDQQRLVDDCGLTNQQSPNGSLAVVFQDPEQRAILRQEFQSSFYWTFDELLQRCLTAGLLFDSAELVRRKIVDLVLTKLQANPGGYGNNLLTEVLRSALAHNIAGEDSSSMLLAQIDARQIRSIRTGLFEMLVALANSSTSYGEPLAKLAADNIEKLIELGCHATAWHLANRLRDCPAYSEFYLHTLKRLFDEAPNEFSDVPQSMKEHYNALKEQTLRRCLDGQTSLTMLTSILEWIPRDHDACPSRSCYFSLELALQLAELSMYDPTSALMLSMFDNQREDARMFQDALLCAVLHPALDAVVTNEIDEEHELGWMLSLFFPLSFHDVDDPPLWPFLITLKFLAGTEARQLDRCGRFRILTVVSWARAAQRAAKDPRPIIKQFWQALPKRDRMLLRDLLSFMGDTCLDALILMNAMATDRYRSASREAIKASREAIRLVGTSMTMSQH